MASEKRKYKYGSNTLDYDNYITNLNNNVLTFLNSQNWSDEQKQEFSNAYTTYIDAFSQDNTGRFSTDAFGTILDNQGSFTSDIPATKYYDKSGKSIDSATYATLKDRQKKKYATFNANELVARYFNDIAKEIVKKNPAESNKFDFSKHGFYKYWSDKINPAGGTFNLLPFVDKDALVDGRRARTERAKYLADEIKSYKENLGDYDFSHNVFGSRENYITALDNLERSLRDGTFDSKDAEAALAAGVDQDFFNQFFTEYDTYKTDEEAKKEQEERDLKAAQEERNKWVDSAYNIYDANKGAYYDDTGDKGFYIGNAFDTYKNDDGSFNSKAWDEYFNKEDFKDYYDTNTNYFSPTKFGESFLENPYDTQKVEHTKHYLAGLIHKGLLPKISSGKYEGMYYFKDSYSDDTNRVLVYNPKSGKLFYRFVGDVPDLWLEKVKQANLRGYTPPSASSGYYFKLGGTIKHQFGGNIDEVFKSGYKADLEKRAKKAGKTVEQQKAVERYINDDYTSSENDAGFTHEEWLRLGSAAADLISAGAAFAPGVGTLVSAGAGLASTGTNLVADWTDDNVSGWETAGNALFGLGMDAVGLIPGLGMVGKTAKVGRSLAKLAPKVMAWIAAGTAAANSPAMLNSWGKLASEEKLTSEDWENIMQSLNLLLGGSAAIGRNQKAKGNISLEQKDYSKLVGDKLNKKLQNQARQESFLVEKLEEDKIAVKMKDLDGKDKTVVFEGEDARKIREADGDVDIIKELTIDKYQDLKDHTLLTTMLGKAQSPVKSWKLWSSDSYQAPYRKKVDTKDVYTTGWGRTPFAGKYDPEVQLYTPQRAWKDVDDAFVESQIAPLRQASQDYEKNLKISSANKARVEKVKSDVEGKLAGRKSSELADEIADIRTRYAKYNKSDKLLAKSNLDDIDTKLKDIKNAEDLLKKTRTLLNKERGKRKPDESEIERLEASEIKYQDKLNELAGSKGNKKRNLLGKRAEYKKEYDGYVELEHQVKDLKNKEATRKEVERLEQALDKLDERKIYWDQFKADGKSDARVKFDQDYTVTDGNVTFHDPNTGRDIVRNYEELLKGIKFKKGGRITKFQLPAGPLLGKPLTPRLDFTRPLEGQIKFETPSFKFQPSKSTPFGTPELMEDGTLRFIPTSSPYSRFTFNTSLAGDKKSNGIKPTGTKTAGGGGDETSKQTPFKDFLSNLNNAFQNPTLLYSVPRALNNIEANRKMTNMAIAAEKPILKQSLNLSPISVHSDLSKETAAQNSAALLTGMASQPFTSDGRLQQAAMFDAQLKGLDYINQGKQASDEVYLNTMAEAKKQNDIEATKNLAVANENIAAMHATANNITKHQLAGMSQELKIKDTLYGQFENEYRSNDTVREALFRQDQKTKELDNAINGSIEGITPAQLELLKKYKQTGTTGMQAIEQQELNKALAIINDRVLTSWANMKGIYRGYISPYNSSSATDETIRYNILKKGGSLTDKNNELLIKSIKEHNKKIDKLSKTMINYFKDIKKK